MKKSNGPQSNVLEPKWRTIEKVVALLEQSLSPEARVTHNVKLPNLITGHLEQCDVLIEMGQEPRIIRTIVEVQKRTEKVKPNDFRGWCQKMKEVVAHRLICVSAKPFSQSIKDSVVKEYGPTVLLVRLEALEKNDWPFQIVNQVFVAFVPEFEVDKSVSNNPRVFLDPANWPFVADDDKFINFENNPNVVKLAGKDELLPFRVLINEGLKHLQNDPAFPILKAGTHQINYSWTPNETYVSIDGKLIRVTSVSVSYVVKVEAIQMPIEISSYSQEAHKTLAWVIIANGTIESKSTSVRLTLTQNTDGGFKINAIELSGYDEGCFFVFKNDKGDCTRIDFEPDNLAP